MSTVHVFVGQCGTQLGTSFLDELVHEAECSNSNLYQELVSSRHFRLAMHDSNTTHKHKHHVQQNKFVLPEPRCVMVDMEPKVIEEAVKRVNGCRFNGNTHHYYNNDRISEKEEQTEKEFYYENKENYNELSHSLCNNRSSVSNVEAHNLSIVSSSTNEFVHESRISNDNNNNIKNYSYMLSTQQCVTRGEGSGNNWAFGYYHQGESRREAILECLRRECEWSDYGMSCIHVIHAIAGGTGSGVGSLVAEVVKDHFPSSLLLHSLVWPFATGEVVTQWYNLILSLQSLQECVDGACILYNDDARQCIMNKLATRGLERTAWVDYNSMNTIFSQLLTPLHLPQERHVIQPLHNASYIDETKHNNKEDKTEYDMHKSINHNEYEQHTSSRLVRMSDVVESISLDPLGKFFVAKAAPETELWGMSWNAILNSAVRMASEFHTSVPRLSRSSLSSLPYSLYPCHVKNVRNEHNIVESLLPWQYCYRRCLWTLRGPGAESDGVRELHRLCSEYYNNLQYHQNLDVETGNTSPTFLSSSNVASELSTAARVEERATWKRFPLTALFVSPWNTIAREANTNTTSKNNDAMCVFEEDSVDNITQQRQREKQRVKNAWFHESENENCNSSDNSKNSRKTEQAHMTHYELPSSTSISSLGSLSKPHTGVRDVARERRSVTIIRPTREVVLYGPMEQIGKQCAYAVRRAEKLLHVNAYLHHYDRYGVCKDDLLDACATLWDIAANYTDINNLSY